MVVGSFAEVLVGAVVGYARDLQLQSTSLLEEKSLMEQALRESQERFELAAAPSSWRARTEFLTKSRGSVPR